MPAHASRSPSFVSGRWLRKLAQFSSAPPQLVSTPHLTRQRPLLCGESGGEGGPRRGHGWIGGCSLSEQERGEQGAKVPN